MASPDLDPTRYAPLSALLAQLVEHFHGKEGVDGSSPSEGFTRFAGIFGRLGFASSWPEGPLRVHRAAGRSNLILCRDALAVPVLDDSGVVLPDHPHAGPHLLGDLG